MTKKNNRYFGLCSLLACICLLLLPAISHAQNYSDIWYNPNESGWGLTIADHNSQLFAVWFTYRQDGKSTWYVIPGGTFSNNRQRFQGDMYATTGPAYSAAAFDPSRVTATKVGTATIDFSSYAAATFTYSLAGVTQTKTIARQPFGNGSPVWGNDVTDIWWNAAENGWGLTLAQHNNNIFGVWFTYDTDGQPLWAVMPGVTFSDGHTFTGTLYTTTGPYFASQPFDSSRVVVKQDGSATFSWTKSTTGGNCGGNKAGTFRTALRGASRQAAICQQPFGRAAALPTFPASTSVPNGAALFTAPANPINATIVTDDATSAAQLITTAGGSISLTDAGGNKFTLVFPPNAVAGDTSVKMTAIRTVSGPRYSSGTAFGLKLEPDGLVLQDNAILTVEPARAFPLNQQTGFAADGDGNDLHLAPPGPDFSRIQLAVGHFSFWGWLFMTPAERAAESRLAQAVANDARLWNQITSYLNGVRQSQLTGTTEDAPPSVDQVVDWMNHYYTDIIKPYLSVAGASCFNATRAYTSVNKLFNARKNLGTFDDFGTYITDIDTVAAGFNQARTKTACYFKQEAKFEFPTEDGRGVATVTAHWRVEEESGNVIKYVPFGGDIDVDYPAAPCMLQGAHDAPGTKDGLLTVDWGSRTWTGAALHLVPITLICPGRPPLPAGFPVFYLGDFANLSMDGFASGHLNFINGIDEESHRFEGGVTTFKFTTACDGGYSIYCGVAPKPPVP